MAEFRARVVDTTGSSPEEGTGRYFIALWTSTCKNATTYVFEAVSRAGFVFPHISLLFVYKNRFSGIYLLSETWGIHRLFLSFIIFSI